MDKLSLIADGRLREVVAYRGSTVFSGRKNVLRKLLRIPYRRLKAGIFCVLKCVDCVCFVAGVLSEMHEVRTFAPCKAFLFDMFAFFSSL